MQNLQTRKWLAPRPARLPLQNEVVLACDIKSEDTWVEEKRTQAKIIKLNLDENSWSEWDDKKQRWEKACGGGMSSTLWICDFSNGEFRLSHFIGGLEISKVIDRRTGEYHEKTAVLDDGSESLHYDGSCEKTDPPKPAATKF